MGKKLNKTQVLDYMAEYLIYTLHELQGTDSDSFWAFIECLEMLSLWSGFKKFGIPDIEAHFCAK